MKRIISCLLLAAVTLLSGCSVQNADFAKLECAVQRRVQIRARKIAGRLFYISDKLR
ncbi:MAG: hypothetical protein OSJ43_08940 [Oscillospiraceae bacterium]|nr:hypothetical protein [Oscillospiraceae bacterium]